MANVEVQRGLAVAQWRPKVEIGIVGDVVRRDGEAPRRRARQARELDLLDERAETMLDDRVRQLRAETRIVFLDPIRPDPEAAP